MARSSEDVKLRKKQKSFVLIMIIFILERWDPYCRMIKTELRKLVYVWHHYPPRNLLSPIFLKICTNIPQDVPINEHTFVFWNKSLLKSYRNFYIFGFLTVRNYPWFFFTAESLSLSFRCIFNKRFTYFFTLLNLNT